MQWTEIMIGCVLVAVAAVPVGYSVLYGFPQLEPTSCSTAGQVIGCRATETGGSQFIGFWFLISFVLLGLGVWFVISGVRSKAIVSKTNA